MSKISKEHDIRGVQKHSSELLSIAWQKGYQAGFDDGYATRREAEIIPQGEYKTDCNVLQSKERKFNPFDNRGITEI